MQIVRTVFKRGYIASNVNSRTYEHYIKTKEYSFADDFL